MTIKEYLTQLTLAYLGGVQIDNNAPYDTSFLNMNDEEELTEQKIKEYRVRYNGDSDEILQYFTKNNLVGYCQNPLYARNKKNYYWCVSSEEQNIKRVHIDMPHVIVETIVSIVGIPVITAHFRDEDTEIEEDENEEVSQEEKEAREEKRLNEKRKADKEMEKVIDKIIDDNNFYDMLTQLQIPRTLVEGWGAFRIDFDKDLRDTPIISYYDALNVDFIYKQNTLMAVIFKDYYKDERENEYILYDIRRRERNKSIIEKKLFKVDKDKINSMRSQLTPVPLSSLPFLKDNVDKYEINGFNEILAVPSVFYKDPVNSGYGRSIFTGKCDMFDALDECSSQASTTVRRSTPIEYISDDALERDSDGNFIMLQTYDRRYLKKPSVRDGDGNANEPAISTTQPALNFLEYSTEQIDIINMILTGVLSPASLGIEVSKKDNADAQREKEKISILTRNSIIRNEERIINKVLNLALCIQEMMNRGEITRTKYDIGIRYSEFANPSFETQLQILTPTLQANAITPEQFVEMVWKDSLSEEDKEREVKYIKEKQEQDSLAMMQQQNAEIGAELGGDTSGEYIERTGNIPEPKENLQEPIK